MYHAEQAALGYPVGVGWTRCVPVPQRRTGPSERRATQGYNRFCRIDMLCREEYVGADRSVSFRYYVRAPTYGQRSADQVCAAAAFFIVLPQT